jgi:hypothetical protein
LSSKTAKKVANVRTDEAVIHDRRAIVLARVNHLQMGQSKHLMHTSNNLLSSVDLATLISVNKIGHCFDLWVSLVPNFARFSENEAKRSTKHTVWFLGYQKG